MSPFFSPARISSWYSVSSACTSSRTLSSPIASPSKLNSNGFEALGSSLTSCRLARYGCASASVTVIRRLGSNTSILSIRSTASGSALGYTFWKSTRGDRGRLRMYLRALSDVINSSSFSLGDPMTRAMRFSWWT